MRPFGNLEHWLVRPPLYGLADSTCHGPGRSALGACIPSTPLGLGARLPRAGRGCGIRGRWASAAVGSHGCVSCQARDTKLVALRSARIPPCTSSPSCDSCSWWLQSMRFGRVCWFGACAVWATCGLNSGHTTAGTCILGLGLECMRCGRVPLRSAVDAV
eukprot:9600954-Alexandrium_andersonii.AAC.1